jgi:hypothetical protein
MILPIRMISQIRMILPSRAVHQAATLLSEDLASALAEMAGEEFHRAPLAELAATLQQQEAAGVGDLLAFLLSRPTRDPAILLSEDLASALAEMAGEEFRRGPQAALAATRKLLRRQRVGNGAANHPSPVN